MPKVTLGLSDRDAENAQAIEVGTNARSKAHGVSIALSLTRFVVDELNKGNQVVIRKQDGSLERVLMPELENIQRS